MENRVNGSPDGSLAFRWNSLSTPAKAGVIAVGAVIGLYFAVRILPMLVAAMGLGLLVAVLFVPYWIPTITAFIRKHPSKGAILVVNMFFGWTFIGWLVSLVWALGSGASSVAQQTVVVHTTNVMSGSASSSLPAEARVGDVVNGHRFNGTAWVPVASSTPTPLAAPDNDGSRAANEHEGSVQSPAPLQVPPPGQTPG